jgi:hypothetical protein
MIERLTSILHKPLAELTLIDVGLALAAMAVAWFAIVALFTLIAAMTDK